MGGLFSIVKKIEDLHFAPFPTKAIEVQKIARTNGIVVAIGKSGRLYTTSPELQKRAFYTACRNQFFDDVAICLRKLGVITPAEVKAHKEWSEEIGKRRTAQWRLERVEDAFKAAGLELTKSQRAKLERDAGVNT